jgi:hypothetical protein
MTTGSHGLFRRRPIKVNGSISARARQHEPPCQFLPRVGGKTRWGKSDLKSRLAKGAQIEIPFAIQGEVQLRVTRTAPDEAAMADNGRPYFQSWCVHESIRQRGSEAA